eukprot:scaffold3064_cov231-Pinguiococcus_pyrenoidosus.AAC.4
MWESIPSQTAPSNPGGAWWATATLKVANRLLGELQTMRQTGAGERKMPRGNIDYARTGRRRTDDDCDAAPEYADSRDPSHQRR